MKNIHRINGLIYITSEEVVNKNDYITDGYKVWKWKDDSSLLGRLKVILTNDTALTSDGIQAIDPDAEKWLNENPSCEWADVDNRPKISSSERGFVIDNPKHNKIVIPTEEPKCTCVIGHPYNNLCCKVHGNFKEYATEQTIEEAAEKVKYFTDRHAEMIDSFKKLNSNPKEFDAFKSGFLSGYECGEKSKSARYYWYPIFKSEQQC